MEASIRGLIEKYIDDCLLEDELRTHYKYYEIMHNEGIISSPESAMYGHIFGTTIGYVSSLFRRMPDKKELREFINLFHRRSQEIKSRINEIANR